MFNGVFRIILLIYGEKDTNKYVSKFIQDNLGNFMIVIFTKNRFLQQVRKVKLINWG